MLRNQFRFVIVLAIALMSVFHIQAAEIQPVKYVFLFIGDGLSLPQRMMAEEFLKKTENRDLRINTLEFQAVTTTSAANSFITDSAASGTAIACGEKTNNGYLGVTPNGRRLESVAEVAKKSGRKVGIVTSVTLNHATPAAFYAHNSSRGNAYDICLDALASNFDYFGGGGFEKPDDEKAKNYRGDFYKLAEEAGYTISRTPEEFQKIKPNAGKVISLGASGALPYNIDAKPGDLRLPDFTRQAIEQLENPKGFFLMVEGGAIDWMCHANDAATTLQETLEFDDAVGVALKFAEKHPQETLIVVTGDHETGGLTLGFIGTGYSAYLEFLTNQKASTDELARTFRHFKRDNKDATFNDLKPLITEKSGLKFEGEPKNGNMILSENEQKEIESAYKKTFEDEKPDSGALGRAVVRLINAKAGLGWTSNAHTALPVITTAKGPESQNFSNMMDNTDIAKRLKQTVLPL